MMAYIYKKAEKVVIWLGSASNANENALREIVHTGRQVKWTPKFELLPVKSYDKTWKDSEDDAFVAPYNVQMWQEIHDVISRGCFCRGSTGQEICLAHRAIAVMQCGAVDVSWELSSTLLLFFSVYSDGISCKECFAPPASTKTSQEQRR